MAQRERMGMQWVVALVGVPIAFGAYVLISYRVALGRGYLPYTHTPEWYWFAAYGLCLFVGAFLVYRVLIRPTWLRITAGLAYAVAMGVGLLAVQLFVACSQGDCL